MTININNYNSKQLRVIAEVMESSIDDNAKSLELIHKKIKEKEKKEEKHLDKLSKTLRDQLKEHRDNTE